MSQSLAARSGQFKIGGEYEVNRLGFGAMRVTGPGIWGLPKDKKEAIAVLQRAPELGINFIDTAESYGPHVSEELIREALSPHADDLVIATKGGLTRGGPEIWGQDGRPEKLIADAKGSLKRLGVEQHKLWQLHRIDAKVPANEQFDAVKSLLDDGIIAHAGLSEVNVDQIKAAQKVFPVATVQNLYNLANRQAKTCSAIAKRRTSASSHGTRSPPATLPAKARCSTESPKPRAPRLRKSRWPGC
jgi:pyridoxine 4-dehydrogenase